MAEEKKAINVPHNLILEDRRLLTVSGVSDVDSFDDRTVVIFTEQGELTVTGENLHISRLSIETGELLMEGKVSGLSYAENEQRAGGGFFSKVFR